MKSPLVKSKVTTKLKFILLSVFPTKSGIRNLNELVEFYLYRAPQIDSIHSCGKLKETIHDKVFLGMLAVAEMRNRKSTKVLKTIQSTSFSKMDIDGSELNFRTPRMLCAKGRNETDLTALLRHIRNSFAHGRLYVKKTRRRNFICLEDLDLKRKLSAGIVLTDMILQSWKTIIDGYCRSENMI